MWIITVAVLLAGGLLGAANLIIAKKPNAKELIEKLTPYQGWIGVVLVLWGIWDLVGVFRSLGVLSAAPVWWVLYLVTAVTELALGFLLGYGLISKYVLGSSPQALEKGQQLRARLANYQGPLGVVAIGLAIIFAVLTVIR
ncbi:MAG TPA: hypothetical protein VM487_14985 [Phycisphaerae bacterium]|nr:hypothetical protein [Phycisphaerae bacterium]